MTGTMVDLAWPVPSEDPYPALAELRARAAVHPFADLDFEAYLVVSHKIATNVLQDPEWSSDPTKSPQLAERLGLSDAFARSVLFADAPDHARLRRSLRGWLSPRSVEALRPRVEAIVEAAVSGVEPGAPFDVMDELAYPVPLAVICELLGAPPDVAEVLRYETPRMVDMLDPLAGSDVIEVGAAAAFGAMLALVPLVAERLFEPRNDMLSTLVQSAPDGLETDEAITMVLLLLAAGHETTANLVGNGVAVLHNRPDVVRELRRHPELLPQVVEELLRFDGPVQQTARVATRRRVLGDIEVRAGSQVVVSLGAANRDGAVFSDPDRFDVHRDRGPSLAFGHGPHFCAGASLARCEAIEMLRALLSLDPPLEERELVIERGTSITFRRVRSAVLSS
jgi:cytochrome P450